MGITVLRYGLVKLGTLDTITQYGTGPTAVQVDHMGYSFTHQKCRYTSKYILIGSDCSAQMSSERAGDYSSS